MEQVTGLPYRAAHELLDSIPAMIGMVQPVGEQDLLHVMANPAAAQAFGSTAAAIAGRLFSELKTSKLTSQLWVLHCLRVARSGKPEQFSYWTEGSERHMTVQVSYIEGSAPRRYCYLLRDTTEQEKLREDRSRYEVILDTIPQIVWTATPEGAQDYANLRWYEFNGIDRTRNEPQVWKSVIHPDDHEITHEAWSRSLKTGDPYSILHRSRRDDGDFRWVLTQAMPQKDRNGKIVRWIGSGTDITGLRKAEDALRDSEARFRRSLMDTPFPAIMHAEDGKIVLLNREWQRLTGYDPKEVKTIEQWAQLAYGKARVFAKDYIDTLYSLDQPLNEGEWSVRTRGGQVRIWDISATPIGNLPDGRRLVLSMARDITDLKKLQDELRHAIRSRDEFLSIASHELKTPLTLLKLQLDLMNRVLKKGDEPNPGGPYFEKALIRITRQGEKLNRLVDDMLDISSLATGNLSLDLARHDLSQTVRDLLSEFQEQFAEAGIGLSESEVQDGIEAVFDRVRIEQVLSNLLSNALKYGKSDKPVEVSLKKKSGSRVELAVRDYGLGIAKEDQGRIFGRFERAIPGTKISGFGLGLFISQEIVNRHGGSIRVESEPGRGSRFIMELQTIEERSDVSIE